MFATTLPRNCLDSPVQFCIQSLKSGWLGEALSIRSGLGDAPWFSEMNGLVDTVGLGTSSSDTHWRNKGIVTNSRKYMFLQYLCNHKSDYFTAAVTVG